jgi:hypothetical protein
MAQTIKLKRSATAGTSGIPSLSDLALGEVGINTYHGKMYIKKDDGTESIVEVNGLPLSGGTLTGSLDVTGSVTSTGLTVDGDSVFFNNGWIKSNSSLRIDVDNDNNQTDRAFFVSRGNASADMLKVAENGHISFYNSAGSSQNFYWDSSTSRLGLGTTVPSRQLSIYGTNDGYISFNGGRAGNHEFVVGTDSSGFIIYDETLNALRLVIDQDSGNVGINVSNPSAPLHINAAGKGDIYSGLIQNSTTDTDHYNVVRFMQGASGSATGYIGTGGSTTGNPAFRNSFVVGTQTSSPLVFATNDTERARIDSSGAATFSGSVTSTGLTVTGTLGNWSIDAQGAIQEFTRNSANYIKASGALGSLSLQTGGSNNRLRVAHNGDIYFYNDSAAQAFYWDSSTSRLGLGVTNPSSTLDILGNKDATNVKISAALHTVGGGSLADYSEILFDNTQVSGTSGQAYLRHYANSHNDQESAIAFGTTTTGGTTSEALRIRGDGSSVFSGAVTAANVNIKQSAVSDINGLNGIRLDHSTGTAYSGFGLHNTDAVITAGDAGGTANTNLLFRTATSGSEAERMRIDSSGRVGIGSGNPLNKLDIEQIAAVSARLLATGATSSSLKLEVKGGATQLTTTEILANSSGAMTFATGTTSSTERMRIDASGNVGIGQSAPSFKLHVTSADANDDVAYIHHDNAAQSSGTLLKVRSDAGASNGYSLLDVQNNSGTALYVAGDNKVGIGTSSPSSFAANANNLVVGSGSGTEGITINSGSANYGVIYFADGTSGSAAYAGSINYNHADNSMRLGTNGSTTDVFINSSGSVGIGTSSPVEKLYVNSTSGDVRIGLNAPTGSDAEIKFSNNAVVNYSIGHDDATDNFVIGTDNVDTPLMSVNKAGNVGIGTSSPTSYADTTLHVSGSTGSTLKLSSDAQGNANTDGFDISHSGVTAFINNRENGEMQFRTNNVEAMRIDSSGNLLVGTTSTSLYNDTSGGGINLFANGGVTFAKQSTSSSDPVLLLNNTGTEGQMIDLRQDGATVGIIGTFGSVLNLGTGSVGLSFYDGGDAILPRTAAGAAVNGTIDLGGTAALGGQFKDLYLSGVSTAGSYKVGTTEVIDSSRIIRNISSIYNNANSQVMDLNNADSTIINDPDNHSCLLLSGGSYDTNYYSNDTHYFRGRDALDIHAIIDTTGIKSFGDYKVGSQTVIDASRNLTNIGTVSSGAITSSGAISGTNGAFSGSLALSADSSQLQLGTGNRAQIFHNSAALYLRTSTGGVNVQASGLNHYSADASTLYFSAASGGLSFGGTQFLTSSRNLTNIGTISSGAITSSGDVNLANNLQLNSRNFADSSDLEIARVNTSDQLLLGGGATATILKTAGGGNALTINSSGNATFAGTISSGAITSTGTTKISGSHSSTITTPNINSFGALSAGTAYNYHIMFKQADGTVRGQITNNIYGTQYTTSSDYRLKENVQPLSSSTSRTLALNPCTFEWIDDADNNSIEGFLAHEVAAIVPEAVVGTKDALDADGNPEYQTIDQSKLIPILVKTIQELEARITALESA